MFEPISNSRRLGFFQTLPHRRRLGLQKLSFVQLESRQLMATFAEAGISQRAINYVNGLQSNWSSLVQQDQAVQNTLKDIISTQAAPASATVITSEAQFPQIVSGGTYIIRGELTVAGTFQVPGNVTIYVDGSIFKQGAFTATGTHVGENRTDAIFRVSSKNNVNLYGLNNARLSSNPNLLVTAPHASAIIIDGSSSNVRVEGFEISSVYQGVDAMFGTSNVTIENNYIHDTVKRAIWFLGTTGTTAAHNFIENPGVDGIDFDAYTKNSYAFENVVIGAGRWAGFVEEGANNNYLTRGVAIMADFGNPNTGYQMAWADNGTSPNFTANNPGLFTRNNYFIDNVVFRPTGFPDGGDYFAKTGTGTQKGPTYFWSNRGYGAGQSTTLFQNAEWLTTVPTAGGENSAVNGVKLLNDLDLSLNRDAGFADLFDYDFTAGEGFNNGILKDQKGFVGQTGTTVDATTIGVATASGGSFVRNAYGTNLLSAAGKSSFSAGERMKFTIDYQLQLSQFGDILGGSFGILDSIANFGALSPQQGFQIGFSTTSPTTGGMLQLISNGITTSLSAKSFGLNPNGSQGPVDLQSDPFRVTYELTWISNGTYKISQFEILNRLTNIRTELPIGSTFTFAGTPFYSQGLAMNGDSSFVGVSDGVRIEYAAAAVTIPTINSIVVNNGLNNQRNFVDRLQVTFNGLVDVSAGAFSVLQRSNFAGATGTPVGTSFLTSVTDGNTVATVLFTSLTRNNQGALQDGNYELKIDHAKIKRAGTDYILARDAKFGDSSNHNFYAMFGDLSGTRTVGAFQLLAFRMTYGKSIGNANYNAALDYNGDGVVNAFDLLAFRGNYGKTLAFV